MYEEYSLRFYMHTEELCFISSPFQYNWLGNDMNQFLKAQWCFLPEVVFNETMNVRSCLKQLILQRFIATFFPCFSAQKYCFNTKYWMSRIKKILENNLRGEGGGKEERVQNMKCKIKQGSIPSGGHCPHQPDPWPIGFKLCILFFFFFPWNYINHVCVEV